MYSRVLSIILAALIFSLLTGCQKSLTSLPPTEIVKLYQKALNSGDKEQLKRLVFTEPTRSAQETDAWLETLAQEGKRPPPGLWKLIAKLFRITPGKEKISGDTAYVYVWASTIIGNKTPFEIIVLEKQDGIWKVKGPRRTVENPTIWKRQAVATPPDPDAVFLLGESLTGHKQVQFNSKTTGRLQFLSLPTNPELAYKQFKRYLILEPEGFWSIAASSKVASYEKLFRELTHCRNALEKKPQDPEALLLLGRFYGGNAQYIKANEFIKRFIIAASPQHPQARFAPGNMRINETSLAIQKEYFTKYPEKLKEIECMLGYQLFEDDYYKTLETPKPE